MSERRNATINTAIANGQPPPQYFHGHGRKFPEFLPPSVCKDAGQSREKLETTTLTGQKHHQEFYFEDGNVVILVEDTLYKLYRSLLEKYSTVFHEMWAMPPPPESTEGTTDDDPIVLHGISVADFNIFLQLLYPSVQRSFEATTDEEWMSSCNQGNRWGVTTLPSATADKLKAPPMNPVTRIVLWAQFGLDRNALVPAYSALIARPQSLTAEEAYKIGTNDVAKLTEARNMLHAIEQEPTRRPGHVHAAVMPYNNPSIRNHRILAIVKRVFGIPQEPHVR
ncbi:hypothetical protein WOLCODRAFT_99816 [Wolfiporia cocos MD-104 SS10]|uniref:BTB domain-containing protein n=1 Tax=Wolfiporia cocos (strain MD-104) TaxID=742152 RepID=A0A2H3JFX3_WOLCO|nr:hypothetical protein WOLCODRAFT_99816 [Wolfiporia cocos MD-104 SS10]